MFFALRGGARDGHEFAEAALEAGARVAVVEDRNLTGKGYFYVQDTLKTLQELAMYHRRQLAIPIIALTGSNGKTTTKELAYRVLSRKFCTAATQGNLNNHIGVPLTLLSMGANHQIGIVEMGANHCGEIRDLCRIAEPNIGLITNIGRAHLEGFGGVQGVRQGKGELYDYLSTNQGLAIYNGQDPILSEMVSERPTLQSIPYCLKEFKLQMPGNHNQLNAAAAAAIGCQMGVSESDIRLAIESYTPDNNRSQVMKTGTNALFLDCYNANPSSMRASIEMFAIEDYPHKIAILGDMLELGEYAALEHSQIVELARAMNFEKIYFVGHNFVQALPFEAFPDTEALTEHLIQNPLRQVAILLKGSRGIALEKMIPVLSQ